MLARLAASEATSGLVAGAGAFGAAPVQVSAKRHHGKPEKDSSAQRGVEMRNQFRAACAMCGTTLEESEATVLIRGRRSPYPVICDLCMPEVSEMESEARMQDGDPG